MVRGSCLCGGVRFEVEPPFLRASHCHCDRCRKHSGTAVCTQARVKKEQFRLLQGADLIRVYGKGEGAVKAFCQTCGSSLFGGDWPEGDQVSIRMGAFDDDPGIRPNSRGIWPNQDGPGNLAEPRTAPGIWPSPDRLRKSGSGASSVNGPADSS